MLIALPLNLECQVNSYRRLKNGFWLSNMIRFNRTPRESSLACMYIIWFFKWQWTFTIGVRR